MRNLIYLLLFLTFILVSCGGSGKADKEFDEAERIMAVDSIKSWRILKNIDQEHLSERQKNRLFLDTLYYKVIYNHKDTLTEKELMYGNSNFSGDFNPNELKWLLIKSHDAYLNHNPEIRLENLKDAEFLATQLGRKEELSFTYLYLSNLYFDLFNTSTSKYFAEKSANIFRELNYPIHLRKARLFLISSLARQGDLKLALDSIEAMKPEVMANASEQYKIFFMDQLARIYAEGGKSEKSIEIWHELYDNGKYKPSAGTLAYWAYAYGNINQMDSAFMFIKRALESPHSINTDQLCLNIQRSLYKRLGQYEKFANIDSLQTQVWKEIETDRKIEQSSISLNVKYENDTRKLWAKANKARLHCIIAIFVSLIFILIFIIIWLFMKKRNRMLRLEHENDILKIQTLQNNLFESHNRNKETNSKISELFQSRFKLMDNLASTYFECKDTSQEQKRIYNDVKKAMTDFSSKETTHELTDILNAHQDKLMEKFKSEFPSLSTSQYQLALYLFCGFSLPSISVFAGRDVRNIYVYKSRLKAIISKSDSPLKDIFLKYFI